MPRDVTKDEAMLLRYSAELHELLEIVWYTPAGRSVPDAVADRIVVALGPTKNAMPLTKTRHELWWERQRG
jgi:hypothetical protein